MSNFLSKPLTEQEQQRLLVQFYGLLERQVKSYHKNRHMGQNSSIPTELAQELMASVEYTIGLMGDPDPNGNLEQMLRTGQEILEEKRRKAMQMLHLVVATAPDWQTHCRWEAIECLRRYLEDYDHLHLAHCGAENLFYPISIPVPEGLVGIDQAQFYLTVLWSENQIMAAFADHALENLWARLPADALNQCEQVILNAIGKAMLQKEWQTLTFTQPQWTQIEQMSAEEFRTRWAEATVKLSLGEYGILAAQQLFSGAFAAQRRGNTRAIFL